MMSICQRLKSVGTLCTLTALAGCGVVTAPLSVASAVSKNDFITFKGDIVDTQGRPIDQVLIEFDKTHTVWSPLSVEKTDYENYTTVADHKFDFSNVRASQL